MNLLFEDMIRVETGQFVCRIWRQQSLEVAYASNNERLALIAKQLMLRHQDQPRTDIIKEIVEYQGVNSVEIIDRFTGCGVCVHKDWP